MEKLAGKKGDWARKQGRSSLPDTTTKKRGERKRESLYNILAKKLLTRVSSSKGSVLFSPICYLSELQNGNGSRTFIEKQRFGEDSVLKDGCDIFEPVDLFRCSSSVLQDGRASAEW